MFGNPILRDRFTEAKAPSSRLNGGQDGDSENETDMVAETINLQKPIKQKPLKAPDEYDDHGLPPMVKEAKKEIR